MLKDIFLYISKLFFPNGLAFKVFKGSFLETLLKAIIGDETTPGTIAKIWQDANSIQYAQLPDNPNFTIDDAHDWFRRLGIYDPGTLLLSDMIPIITQRMSFAGAEINQQTAAYIQSQLHAAGFTNCNVFKNNYGSGGEAISPYVLMGGSGGFPVAMSGSVISGTTYFGEPALTLYPPTKIVNYIEEIKDAYFFVYPNYRSTFFIALSIGGIGTISNANVPIAQKEIFRQLLLKLKAQQLVCFAFVSYY